MGKRAVENAEEKLSADLQRLSVGYQHHQELSPAAAAHLPALSFQDRHVQAPQEAALMRLQWYCGCKSQEVRETGLGP